MSRDRQRVVASWTLALLAAVALLTGGVLRYADHTTFRSDPFADRVEQALQRPAVRAALAHRITDAVVGAKPDLLTARPLLVVAADGVVATDAFRALMRRAARDVHRSAFTGREVDTPILRVRDAGLLLADALRRLRPELAPQVPEGITIRVAAIAGGVDGALLDLAQRGEEARRWTPVAFVVALLLALAAVAVSPGRRSAVVRLGCALIVGAGLVLVGCALAPGAAANATVGLDDDAVRAIVDVWVEPLAAWAAAAGLVGFVVALAAASVVRPVRVAPVARRARRIAATTWEDARGRVALSVLAGAAGVLLIASPRGVLTWTVRGIGAVAVLAAIAEVLALAAAPAAVEARGTSRRRARLRRPGLARVGAVAAVLAAAALGAAALAASGDEPDIAPAGRCNGSATLCDRQLDEVAFLGTHNSMAADREPGWLFAAQDAGIPRQLDDGVRALLVDTHYGFPARSGDGVVTDLSGPTKSRAKLVDQVGEQFVRTAERLRRRMGPPRTDERRVYLCHAFCEVGATDALTAFAEVHRFLVTHPEEVMILSIEDDTSAQDTAELLRRSGLAGEAYRGPARPPWPTLREMIDRGERLLVLVENEPATEAWIHLQSGVAQETPYRFRTVAELAAPASCEPNRGGTAGSLLLVNHWVDTSPAPRVTIAREVNARDFLDRRLALCRRRGRPMPNVLAVDFYATGDSRAVVDRLNGG